MNTELTIYYADGRPSTSHRTLNKAKAVVREETGAKILETFDDRTICWMTLAAAKNDNGAKAVAIIYDAEAE